MARVRRIVDVATGTGDARHDRRARALADHYDESYYARYGGAPYRWGERVWHDFFGRVADAIVAELRPKSVLDAGCGIGFLVGALRDRGVEAYGLDLSEYAISQVPDEIRPYCRLASVTEELERDYDLIVCLEVLEHLPPDLGERAIENLARHAEQILFSSTSTDFSDASHLGIRPIEDWIDLFGRHGFFRNVDVDAGFVAPHAVPFARSDKAAGSVARDYERWHWSEHEELTRLREEAEELQRLREAAARGQDEAEQMAEERDWWRDEAQVAAAELAEWEAFRGRSGYRIFLRLANLRLLLAPRGTMRDRVVRRSLRRVADLADVRSTGRARSGPAALRAVLFVSACPGDARRYRCFHQADQLALEGATVDIADHAEVDLEEVLDRYGAFVLHRVPWGRDVRRFIEEASLRQKAVLFDTDDLEFDPEARKHVAALAELDEEEQRRHVQAFRRFQRTLRACDGVTVSTEPLRAAASRFHERVEVTYNAASDEMTRQADAAVAAHARRESGDAITIGYFSGTHTHNVDFLEVADAILWALETYANVAFLVVGQLKLDPRFDAYGERVRRLPLQPWQSLPELLVQTDVNLAPLQPDNPFTDSKSCIKYVEAGLVGTPTIASPRSDFARAIEHGRNGLLAESPDEWRNAIRALVESPTRRRALGRQAFEDVRRNHTVRARSRRLRETIAGLVRPDGRAALAVNWVLRPANWDEEQAIVRLADDLAARGHTVRIYAEQGATPPTAVNAELHTTGHDALAPADATIATDARTARVVDAHTRSLFKLLFVQAVEGASAADAYALPLRHVCSSAALAEELAAQTGKNADAIEVADAEQLERVLRDTCFVRLRARAS